MSAPLKLPGYLRRGQVVSRLWLAAGFIFLYLPILALVVESFNASPMPSVWGGFTLEWFTKLAHDDEILGGLWLSLKIAFCTACAAVLLGTLAAWSLAKFKRFQGRTLMVAMINAPLVMPEVIIGLSLLLMLVSVQRALGHPERGMATIWMGHLLVGMAYATVVIQARLKDLNPQLEEAAQDLGARPLQVFMLVTLPMIAQSMASAWLLTFTLSLDDVVLAAFLSGPGSSTLPLVIFSRARLGVDPSVNAVATVVIAVVSLVVIGGSYALARAERRRMQEIAQAAHSSG
jgi:putrescine transport system permease protein